MRHVYVVRCTERSGARRAWTACAAPRQESSRSVPSRTSQGGRRRENSRAEIQSVPAERARPEFPRGTAADDVTPRAPRTSRRVSTAMTIARITTRRCLSHGKRRAKYRLGRPRIVPPRNVTRRLIEIQIVNPRSNCGELTRTEESESRTVTATRGIYCKINAFGIFRPLSRRSLKCPTYCEKLLAYRYIVRYFDRNEQRAFRSQSYRRSFQFVLHI